MSLAQVNTEMAAAVAALQSADYDTALLRALCAQGLIAAMPDSTQGSESITWNIDQIDKFVANVRREKNAADAASDGGIQRTKVTYARATD